MTLEDLTDAERVVFAGLVRAVVHADGVFSESEQHVLSHLADEVGALLFWRAMPEAQATLADSSALLEAAACVERSEVREWMYSVLVGLSAVDGMSAAESNVLGDLSTLWQMD